MRAYRLGFAFLPSRRFPDSSSKVFLVLSPSFFRELQSVEFIVMRDAEKPKYGSKKMALAGNPVRMALMLGLLMLAYNGLAQGIPDVSGLRRTTSLNENWKFIQDDNLTDQQALRATGEKWQTIALPHTWNAQDAAGLHITKPYKRGIGWYRLEFDTPKSGARRWLEFGAASIVADVWLNGEKLGQHKALTLPFDLMLLIGWPQAAETSSSSRLITVSLRSQAIQLQSSP